jgi:NADPH:quinone reductase-like Zn-dependent oxidoreductase
VNPADWYSASGTPLFGRPQMGLLEPKDNRLGTDFAGEVEDVGSAVTSFSPGDEVFGARTGAFAEYVTVRVDRAIVRKPEGLTFEEAAAVPIAGITALQGLRDKGELVEGGRVLVNGASGGVGTFAVQIARALGGEVTGVCSTRNLELVRSLGADHVVDYTREDFTRSDRRYDLLLDVVGGRSFTDCRRVLAQHAIVVVVGGPKGNRFLGPLSHVLAMRLASMRASQTVRFFLAKLDPSDLETLRGLLEGGTVNSVVDRAYSLAEAGEALRYLGEGHARGKVVLTV